MRCFSKVNEKEVIEQSKKSVEFSANQIQLKFIEAFRHAAHTEVISAPFIGHYPNQSRTLHFHGFTKAQSLCKYVHFNNIWGISNISRTCALKKAVRDFALRESGKKLIVVYSAHYPFWQLLFMQKIESRDTSLLYNTGFASIYEFGAKTRCAVRLF